MQFGSSLFRRQAPGLGQHPVDEDGFPETVPCGVPLDALDLSHGAIPAEALEWGADHITDLGEIATEVAMPGLRTVGVGDLRHVASHVVTPMPGATQHVVRFRNGGHVKFSYGIDGSVVELSGERITAKISVQGDVLVTAYSSSGASAAPSRPSIFGGLASDAER